MSPIEAVAVLFGLANIVLLMRRSIWNYPAGIAMVLLYAHIFWRAKLYGDAALQLFFLTLQLYGWRVWLRDGAGAADDGVRVARLPPGRRAIWLAGIAVAALAWGWAMRRFTDASLPWWDAAVAALSVAAQLMLAWRYVENWALWVIVDLLAIGLYAVKGLWPTAALYALFLMLAIVGWRTWWRAFDARRAA